MKRYKVFEIISMAYGLLITLLFLLFLGPKIIGEIIEKGVTALIEMIKSFSDWSDPVPFFLTYIIGYAILWWKPQWGSIIIILGSAYYVIIAGVDGPPIFAVPAFIVGLSYFVLWILKRKK